MACPSVEHGKAVAASNEARISELYAAIQDAGAWPAFCEYQNIIAKPNEAFTERLRKSKPEPADSDTP